MLCLTNMGSFISENCLVFHIFQFFSDLVVPIIQSAILAI
jgi:hypothetical protein